MGFIDKWRSITPEPIIKDIYGQGGTLVGSGTDIANKGLAGIDSSLADYQAMLKSGRVLPPNVYRAYDLARGGVQDNAARDISANAAGLKQQALAAGGFLSPEAMAEYGNISTRNVQDSAFAANTAIDTSQASNEQSGAIDLMNRVDSLKNTILNAGQFRQTLGQKDQLAALQAKLDKYRSVVGSIHF